MSWLDYPLPTGQVATERINTMTGEVTYNFAGTDATINALDILALAKIVEATLRRFTLDKDGKAPK